jgi:hypothetical protein
MAKFCKNCGKPLKSDDAKFCAVCGASQLIPAASPTVTPAPVPNIPEGTQGKRNPLKLFGILAVIIVVGLAIFVFATVVIPGQERAHTPVIPVQEHMQWFNKTDLLGSDYNKLDVSTPPSGYTGCEYCAQLCLGDPKCMAATYVYPNTIQGPKAWCYLKNPVPKQTYNKNCDSFIKTR